MGVPLGSGIKLVSPQLIGRGILYHRATREALVGIFLDANVTKFPSLACIGNQKHWEGLPKDLFHSSKGYFITDSSNFVCSTFICILGQM